MAKTRYEKAKELLIKLKEEHGEFIQLDKLLIDIRKDIGGDEKRTVKPYIKFMLDTELVVGTDKGLLIKC